METRMTFQILDIVVFTRFCNHLIILSDEFASMHALDLTITCMDKSISFHTAKAKLVSATLRRPRISVQCYIKVIDKDSSTCIHFSTVYGKLLMIRTRYNRYVMYDFFYCPACVSLLVSGYFVHSYIAQLAFITNITGTISLENQTKVT